LALGTHFINLLHPSGVGNKKHTVNT